MVLPGSVSKHIFGLFAFTHQNIIFR